MDGQSTRDASGSEWGSAASELWHLPVAITDARRRIRTAWLQEVVTGNVLVVDPDRELLETLAQASSRVYCVIATVEQAEVLGPPRENVTFRVINAASPLPFDDNSVDAVIWLDAGVSALAPAKVDELVRVVRPTGTVILSSNDAADIDRASERLASVLPNVERLRGAIALTVSLQPPVGTDAARADEIYVVAGRGEAVTSVVEPVESEALDELMASATDLERRLQQATAALRRAEDDNEHLREARELLVQLQADAAEAVELRFERKLFALEISDLEAQLRAATGQIETLSHRVRDLEASTSWKVTAPLRRVTGAVRK